MEIQNPLVHAHSSAELFIGVDYCATNASVERRPPARRRDVVAYLRKVSRAVSARPAPWRRRS